MPWANEVAHIIFGLTNALFKRGVDELFCFHSVHKTFDQQMAHPIRSKRFVDCPSKTPSSEELVSTNEMELCKTIFRVHSLEGQFAHFPFSTKIWVLFG